MSKYTKRKDGRYETKVNTLERDKNGKYIRKPVYGHTIKELEENIQAAKNSLLQGVDIVSNKPTVKEWADKWLEVYKPSIKRSMREVYQGLIRKWLAPLHKVKIDKIRQVQLQEILLKASRELSQSTVDKLYNCIRGVFSTARQNGLTASDVSEKLKKPTGGKKTKRTALTDEEKEILELVCNKHKRGLLPMLIMYAGLRINEALALTWGDVKGAFISVSKTIVYEKNSNCPTIKPSPKTGAGIREIPITPPLAAFLVRPENALDTVLIFDKLYSKTMKRELWASIVQTFSAEWAEAHKTEASGPVKELPKPERKITSHMLRHTYATMLYTAGVDIKTAQRWMGHASITMLLDVYTDLSKKKEQEAVDKLNAFIFGGKPDDISDDTDDIDDTLTTQTHMG